MTKNQLLRIARVQQIDLFFTSKGFARETIYKRLIFPAFIISRRSYNEYLTINAKKELRERYNIDWQTELKKLRVIDFDKLMTDWRK